MVPVQRIINELQVEYWRPAQDSPDIEADDMTDGQVQPTDERMLLAAYDLSIPGFIGLPRWYAANKYAHIKFLDRTVRAARDPAMFDACTLKPRNQDQKDFFDDMIAACRMPGPVDNVANARTGAGKTAAVLHTIAKEIQAPSLIIVPKHKLLRQWYMAIEKYFNPEWAYHNVGWVYSKQIGWENKPIVLGMLPSIAMRDYGLAFYRNFSFVGIDEYHNAGTPRGQNILSKFHARIRIGVTATNRTDVGYRLQRWHMGPPRIKSKQQVMAPRAYVVDYQTEVNQRDINPRYMTSILAFQRHDRDELLARIIKTGYLRDRQMVVLSDRIEHLEKLQRIANSTHGIPYSAMGLVTGQRSGKPKKMPNGQWKTPRIKQSEDEQAEYALRQIRFATYGIFGEGTDIEELDWGLEATPRGKIVQALGRIVRLAEGKETPEWYSIRDIVIQPELMSGIFVDPNADRVYPDLIKTHRGRMASFKEQNATVVSAKIEDIEALINV
jgi:superfamily II DNA or RNA helicase